MTMNRREFLYALGSGTTAIAGWVLIPGCARLPFQKDHVNTGFYPGLAKDIEFRRTEGGGELMRPDELGAQQVVCQVNEFGLKLIENLNGREPIQTLAEKLHKGFNPADLEHTEASVASFLAMLAQAGLLAEPFFVNLHSVEISA